MVVHNNSDKEVILNIHTKAQLQARDKINTSLILLIALEIRMTLKMRILKKQKKSNLQFKNLDK